MQKDGSKAQGLYSLKDVHEAFQRGIEQARIANPTDDRALLFATTPGFHRGFGGAASVLLQNGKAFFFSARIVTYNSKLEWYIGNPMAMGQVLSNGKRVSEEVDDKSILHLHGATCTWKRPTMRLVIIVDTMKPVATLPGASKTLTGKRLLVGEPLTDEAPLMKVLPMPPQGENHEDEMRQILPSEAIAKLVAIRCKRQAVAKGRENERTTKNASLLLLLHEFRIIKCFYPQLVVDGMIAHYEDRGIKFEDMAFRYHFTSTWWEMTPVLCRCLVMR